MKTEAQMKFEEFMLQVFAVFFLFTIAFVWL